MYRTWRFSLDFHCHNVVFSPCLLKLLSYLSKRKGQQSLLLSSQLYAGEALKGKISVEEHLPDFF